MLSVNNLLLIQVAAIYVYKCTISLLYIAACFGLFGHNLGFIDMIPPTAMSVHKNIQKHEQKNNAYPLIIVERLIWILARDYTRGDQP
jgi:hypothetical protein